MTGKYYLTVIILLIFVLFGVYPAGMKADRETLNLEEYFSSEEMDFIKANGIKSRDLEPYLKYQKFNVFKYYQYREAREKYNFSYLESLNYVNNPNYYRFYHNPQKALFAGAPHILVNKCYFLSEDYEPEGLVNAREYEIDYIVREGEEIYLKKEVLDSYQKMYDAAKAAGIELMIFSGYRDYEKQSVLYYQVYNQDDSISARPGFSEHQTGLALDISRPGDGLTLLFEQSPSFAWLMANGHKYGFILRFPPGKESITGYSYEPWHFRYVGAIAAEIREKNLTLEEYIFSNMEI